MNRARVRLLLTLSLLTACALMASEMAAPATISPGGSDARPMPCRSGDDGCLLRTEQIVEAARRLLRRVSLSGHDYGGCGGVILAVLLTPEPCDPSWRARPALPQTVRD